MSNQNSSNAPKTGAFVLEFLHELGINVKRARAHNKMTIETLADKSSLSTVWLSNLEKGKLRNASIESVVAVSNASGVTLNLSSSFNLSK